MNAQHGVGGGVGTREAIGAGRVPMSLADARPRADLAGGETDDSLKEAVARARRLAEDQPEPFRSLSFTALLGHFLRGNGPSDGVGGGPRPSTPAAPKTPPATDVQIAEFLAQRRIDSHPDRVVAIAYYHFHRFDGQAVTTRDLVDGYARSRAKRPQNYPDVIASCMRKGYLVEGTRRDGVKSWVITRTGEARVEQDM